TSLPEGIAGKRDYIGALCITLCGISAAKAFAGHHRTQALHATSVVLLSILYAWIQDEAKTGAVGEIRGSGVDNVCLFPSGLYLSRGGGPKHRHERRNVDRR